MVIASEFSVNGNFRLTKFSVHSYDGGMSLPAIGAPQDLFDLVHECRQALEDGKLREAIAWAAEATLPLKGNELWVSPRCSTISQTRLRRD